MTIPAAVDDQALPEAAALLGPDGASAVRTAVEATGGRVVDLSVVQVMYEPGQAVAVRWNVDVDWPDEGLQRESLVAAADTDGPPAGSFPLEADGLRIGMFRWPHDPRLPGLLLATDSAERPEWWAGCGDDLTMEVLRYRPGRRAVIRGAGRDGEVYVKVLRPHRAPRMLRRHRAMADAGLPVPDVLHADEESGVVVTRGMPGATLRAELERGGRVPEPAELVRLVERLPEAMLRSARRAKAPSESVDRHSSTIISVLPEATELVERVRALIGPSEPPAEFEPVHGDFHDDQILVQDGRISALLDIDGAGRGRRVDDFGTMLGHLVNRAADLGIDSHTDYVDRTRALFMSVVDPVELARQTASTLVGLATGPYRVQEPRWQERTFARLRLAERWAEQMTVLSGSAHQGLTTLGERGVISKSMNVEGAK